MTNPYEFGKIPPQNIEIEEAVLGAILLQGDCISDTVTIISEHTFYKNANQTIYSTMLKMFESNKEIDMLTVTSTLKDFSKLEECGGPIYLSDLMMKVSSAHNIEDHCRIIQESFIKREFIRISSELSGKCFDNEDALDLIEFAERSVFEVTNKITAKEPVHIASVGAKEIKRLEEISKLNLDFSGIPSGFPSLDRVTGGWQDSDLVILAARPSMGKTTLALQIARNAAFDYKKPVAFFSLEMSSAQIWTKLQAVDTGMQSGKMRQAKFDDSDWIKLDHAQGKIEKTNIFIDDDPMLNVFALKAKARKLKMKHDIKLIIVDYLQLMSSKLKHREQQISEISRNLKIVAKELNVPVIALSQLNRSVETRGGDKKPQLSDLRESGAIEQDADMVAFVYRPEVYGLMQYENGESTVNTIEVLIRKQRNGALADIKLQRDSNFTKITDQETNSGEMF